MTPADSPAAVAPEMPLARNWPRDPERNTAVAWKANARPSWWVHSEAVWSWKRTCACEIVFHSAMAGGSAPRKSSDEVEEERIEIKDQGTVKAK